MSREKDILEHLVAAGCLVVEKATNRVWTLDEIVSAIGLDGEDRILAADRPSAVSGPYPGCLQMGSAMDEFSGYPLLGQTEHFYIFAQDPVARVAR